MKVIYLTWGETPRVSGVYGSQVLKQLRAIQDAIPSSEFLLVAGLPIVFSGIIREKFGYIKELRKVRHSLGNIKLCLLPVWAPQNFGLSHAGWKYFHFMSDRILSSLVKKNAPDIVHCRSYHSAFAAIQARKHSGLNYKIIFDARGLFPEESLFRRAKNERSDADYHELKKIEQYLLNECDVTISVSDTMKFHYQKIGVNDCRTIYLSAPAKILKKSKSIHQTRDKQTLCYVGALSNQTWHKPKMLFEVYKKYRQCVDTPHLLIITKSDYQSILKQRGDIPLEEIEITSISTPEELSVHLSNSTFGALPYFIPSTPCEYLIAETMLASKTAEYLTAGLPIIINRYCGGAKAFVESWGVGLVYNPENMEEISKESIETFLHEINRENICDLAESMFCYSVNAKKYERLYCDLMLSI
jgi:glycosyltransferase involved in cell wall biosynthesis